LRFTRHDLHGRDLLLVLAHLMQPDHHPGDRECEDRDPEIEGRLLSVVARAPPSGRVFRPDGESVSPELSEFAGALKRRLILSKSMI